MSENNYRYYNTDEMNGKTEDAQSARNTYGYGAENNGAYPYGREYGGNNGSYSYGGYNSPYGKDNSPYGNGCSPYGYGNSPYGGYPYGYASAPKKSFSQRVKEYFTKKPFSELSVLSGFVSLAVIMHLMFSMVLGVVLGFSDSMGDVMLDGTGFAIIGMLSSVLCVGMPFIIVYMLMNRFESTSFSIPFARPRKGSHAGLLVVAGLGLCYIGNIITGYMTAVFQGFGIEFVSSETTSSLTAAPETLGEFLLNLLYVAVFPAIFEEIAFRGVILQPLRKYGDWFAIGVSSVIFGLVHGNMTQMPFAIIAGIALGYTFVVTGSIWPSVIIHLFNNSLALVYSTVLTQLPEETAMIFSAVCVYGIIAVGIVAFAAYAMFNKNFRRLRQGRYPMLRTRQKVSVYFLMPSMLIAVSILVINVLSDIVLGALL